MSNNLKIAIIQTDLVWEDSEENRQRFTEKIEAISDPVDLIILPEMFTSGFTMQPENVSETLNGKTIQWMKNLASKKQVAISGSLVVEEDNNFYNRLVFVYPNGNIKTYDKRHTFTLAGENKVYQAGNKKLIVDYKGWKICPMICYDLRFPVWARNTENYDLLFYVANWPKPRIEAWTTLLKARAIENMCYCIGVNRIGTDNNGHEYTGNSVAFDALGKQVSSIKPYEYTTEVITISKEELTTTRDKFKFLDDRDEFKMINDSRLESNDF
ncbi:amidohydrolase [Aureibaculum sp. 2210JD6-5]|uniref:amidohydrolase n=1 Tax=Aureibaculum sp. 2210JD6-5 TaxID=3103957 RepID=UPI002AAEE308|nr:amidohydrolase [Aureibaculum sp. 2210JD6-5]MDY7395679.1 amidohydrolase [Aureibaculum sp. 2210JD6-5]